MAWLEYVENHLEDDDGVSVSDEMRDRIAETLLTMPAPDRIALARELLTGTALVVAKDYGGMTEPRSDGWMGGIIVGWNECRKAMLKGGE